MTTEPLLKLNTGRFGTIEYEAIDVLRFEGGLLGFPSQTEFILLCHKPNSPFRWLQSVNDANLAFLVVPPQVYVPNYSPAVSDEVARNLGLEDHTPQLVYTLVTIPGGQPNEMTINLAGPLVINAESRKAQQVVIEDHAYTIRHRVFAQSDRVGESAAA